MTTTVEPRPSVPPAEATLQRAVDAEALLPRKRGITITVEHLLYLGIFALSLILHLWALGDKSLHHDETHHAYYPWLLYTGKGYVHDPLLHGPFLYFISALFFNIFGDNDFTARLSAALFGVVLTVLPFLLRREMGRAAALLASAYLLISPVALYVGRFIRHDIYSMVFELLCIVAIVRYVSTRQARYVYLLGAAFGFMVVNMESSYLFMAIIGSFLIGLTIWHVDWKLLGAPLLYLVLAGIIFTASPPVLASDGVTEMPLVTDSDALLIRNRSDDNWGSYFKDLASVLSGCERESLFACQKDEQGNPLPHNTQMNETNISGQNGLFMHSYTWQLMLLTVLLVGFLIWAMFLQKDAEGRSRWRRAVDEAAPDTLLPALDTLRGRRIWIGLAIYFSIYTIFFTSFFFNTVGVVTGTTGSILYWVGQQGVRRGNQPDLYYLAQLFVYEPMLLVWGFSGALAGIIYGIVRMLREKALTAVTLLPPLLGWWALGAFAVYYKAGEKMPWLTIHMVLPLSLTGAWFAWRVLRRLTGVDQPETRKGLWWVVGAIIMIGVMVTINMNNIVRAGPENARYQDSPKVLFGALGLIAVVMLFYGLWLLYGERLQGSTAFARTVGAGMLALTLMLGAYAVRSTVMLSFINPDVPTEMMVYVQSSPDIARVMTALDEASRRESASGGEDADRNLKILYDNETIWHWYLRNYPNAEHYGTVLSSPPDEDVDVLFIHDDNTNLSESEPNLKEFVSIRLPLRWWFPEESGYRTSKLDTSLGQTLATRFNKQECPRASVVDRVLCEPLKPESINDVWKYMMFRDIDSPLGAVDFKLFVRPRLADLFGFSPTKAEQ
jgi:predicted membrane-bound mannosyltransferase